MRLTLVALIAVLCLAYVYAADDAQPENEQPIGLLDVADQGANHANEGDREARQWGYGGGWGGRGGYGGGWGGRGGYGRGWGGGGWRGGWGGGYGGRGGWGGGWGR